MSEKRTISILLAIIMLVSTLLAACGDNTATTAPTTTTAATTTKAATTASATTTAAVTTTAQVATTTAVATTAAITGGTFRWVKASEPKTLDPGLIALTDTISLQIVDNLFEGLLELDPQLKLVPAAAEALPTLSTDGKTYTFKIKKGLTFTNGDPLTAKDFAYSWNRVAQLGALAPGSFIFTLIEGFNAVSQEKDDTKRAAATVSGIKVVDDYTISITINEPAAYFLTQVSLASYYPVNQKALESKGGKLDDKNSWASEATSFVGNGAFVLKDWKHEQIMRIEANPAFKGSPAPSISGATIEFIKDAATSKLKYDNNELDEVGVPVADMQKVPKDPKYKDAFKAVPLARTTWLAFNMGTDNPFSKNLKLRQAFSYAIDRQLITDGALNGAAVPATTLVPQGFPGYAEYNAYAYNVDKAKQLFKEAGFDTPEKVKALADEINNYGDGKGGGLTINVDRAANKAWMESVQLQLKDTFGLELKLNQISTLKEYTERRDKNKEFLLFRGNWEANYPDPQNFYEAAFVSTSSGNYAGYKNPEYDALVKKANTTTDQTQRMKLYQDAEKVLQADAVYVPIFNAVEMRLIRPTLQNWGYNSQGPLKMKYMQIKKS
jgi:ABC-type transport system substrate-binding protein